MDTSRASTLIFNVEALDIPRRQVNFTLTVSGETLTGTVCADTCGTMKPQRERTRRHAVC
jgi:hypothetical protein